MRQLLKDEARAGCQMTLVQVALNQSQVIVPTLTAPLDGHFPACPANEVSQLLRRGRWRHRQGIIAVLGCHALRWRMGRSGRSYDGQTLKPLNSECLTDSLGHAFLIPRIMERIAHQHQLILGGKTHTVSHQPGLCSGYCTYVRQKLLGVTASAVTRARRSGPIISPS